jgi:hypothetical protein
MRPALLLLAALWALSGPVARADGLAARDAWVALAPPGMAMHAAYLTLDNAGSPARTLVAVEAEGYGAASLHETRTTAEGVMAMTAVEALSVPAGGAVAMRPGGLHLMLEGPDGPRAEGDVVALVLGFADGATLAVEAVVRPMSAGAQGHGHGHGHGG